MAEPITFLSDYGTADEFVGVCHGVIAGISPDSRIFDITHGLPRHDVRGGALMLRYGLRRVVAGAEGAAVAVARQVAVRRTSTRIRLR